MSDRQTQQQRILSLLSSGEWVSLPRILDLRIAKYGSRITELRREWEIELRDEWVGGQRRTAYRILGRKALTRTPHTDTL